MKRYFAMSLAAVTLALAVAPSQAQLLQKLEQNLLRGQGQGQLQGQGQIPGQIPGQMQQQAPWTPGPQAQSAIGNVNLPPGQYLMSNVQTGQAFYVIVENGQMFLSSQPANGQSTAPGQGGPFQMFQQQQQNGVGGLIKSGLGGFLRNQLAPQQQPLAPGQ